MRRSLAVLSILLFLCAALPSSAGAQETVSRDAYVRFDEATQSWSMGTASTELQVRLTGGTFAATSLRSKADGREHIQQRSEEFRVGLGGKTYTGATGPWRLTRQNVTVLPQGEIQLVVTLENSPLHVEKAYVVHPGSSVIRQWVTYRNAGSQPVRLSGPYLLAHSVRADGAAPLTLHYMTGGGYFTGSQMLRSATLSSAYRRTFDSKTLTLSTAYAPSLDMSDTTDDAERPVEIDGVYLDHGYAHPYGSGAHMPWFAVSDARGGVFYGLDYTGRWAADVGTYFDAPAYMGLRVAGFERELKPGESIVTPKAFVGVFTGDLDDMGNELKRWQYAYLWDLTSDDYFARPRYLAEMRWEFGKRQVAWGGGTQDNWDYRMASLFRAIAVMRQVGAHVLWQDAGWHNHIGDNDGPDFAAVKQYLDKHGMELAVWWPLYEVSEQSRILQEHPDWGTYDPPHNAWILDLSRKEVLDYVESELEEKVQKWGEFQWRLDAIPVWPVDKNESVMLRQHHNLMGLMESFRRRHPGASIDVCADGGNLMGFESLRLSDVSQLTDGGLLHVSNYYSSYLFPPDKIDDWTRVGNFTWELARASLTMAAAWTSDRGLYGHEPGLLLNDGIENLRRNFGTYRYLVSQGVAGRWSQVYHPRVVGDDPVYYFQRLSQDGKRGVIILKRFAKGQVTVFPKGLKADDSYDVRFARSRQVLARTGAELMEGGIRLVDPADGELVYIGLPNHPGSGSDATPPQPPTRARKLVATNMGITGVEVVWEPAEDDNWLSYYQVYRDGELVAKIAKGTYYFDVSQGAENVEARYEVQAVDGDGNSSPRVEALRDGDGQPVFTARGGFLAGRDYSYQGANNWRYEEWSAGDAHHELSWNGGLAQMGLYEGALGTGAEKVLVGASWMRPTEAADAVRLFVVPYSGRVGVRGQIHKDVYHVQGNGIRARVMKNDEQAWPAEGWHLVAAGDTTGTDMALALDVARGDELKFIVDSNGNAASDETVWDVEIAYERTHGLRRRTRTEVNDVSTRLRFGGRGWQQLGLSPWGNDRNQGYLPGWIGGTLKVSGTAGDTLTVKFHGTGIELIGQIGSDRGIAAIRLDGESVATIDTYSPQRITGMTSAHTDIRGAARWAPPSPIPLWSIRSLEPGEHVLELAVTGRRNEQSTGTLVGVDSIVVYDGDVIAPYAVADK